MADLREEVKCPICWEIYIDPVGLKCGHSFCQDCITRQLLTQKGSGHYSCPQCKDEFQEWPTLHKNIALRNISEHFLSNPSLETRQCSIHKLDLKYYCAQDAACICVKCLEDEHQGHQVESLDEASEKKKTKMKNLYHKLLRKREEMENRAQSLQEHRRKVEEKAGGEKDKVVALFCNLRRQLEDLEKRVLKDISKEAERISVMVSNLLDQLLIKTGELSRKVHDIDRALMKDPLITLWEPNNLDPEDGDNMEEERQEDIANLKVSGIYHAIRTGVSHLTGVTLCFHLEEPAMVSLDINTAHNDLHISEDMKAASYLPNQNRPKTQQRFQDYTQVISTQNFSSGRHYWEVDVTGSEYWGIGMCYPSIDRGGYNSQIECDEKAWCLRRCGDRCVVIHNSTRCRVPENISIDRVRVYLDYEAGQISFYSLCDPIQHLYTFTSTFTEPIHAALRIWNGVLKISSGNRETIHMTSQQPILL